MLKKGIVIFILFISIVYVFTLQTFADNSSNNTCSSTQSGKNNNNNCNQQNQSQSQDQTQNNNQNVNITLNSPAPQIFAVAPVATKLPSTGASDVWMLLVSIVPLGIFLRKIANFSNLSLTS